MKLKVVSRYQNRNIAFDKDTVIDVDESTGKFLLNDAPGCFQVVKDKPVGKEITHPGVDKMVHKGNKTK